MDALQILLDRGVVQQTTGHDALRDALAAGPVTFYIGFDPTADSLHAGHLMQILVMRRLQELGHVAIAIVGGGTAQVGDPSGKTELRQMLTQEVLDHNTARIRAQLERFLVLDGVRGHLVDNASWLLDLRYIPFLRDVGRLFSVNRMLAAEAYKQRLERGLSFIEFNYQILQAYDYLELFRRFGCTLQVGGDDQWGNILAGVDLIRRCEERTVHAMTTPLITTASGAKMGKTAAGAVWLDPARTSPFDWYQYWLNVEDADAGRFLKLYTFLPLAECEALGALRGADSRAAKRRLAWETTALVHGAEAADAAERAAAAMVSGEAAETLPSLAVDPASDAASLVSVLVASGLARSRSDARRSIEGAGVSVQQARVDDVDLHLGAALAEGPVVVRVGKKRAVRVVSAAP